MPPVKKRPRRRKNTSASIQNLSRLLTQLGSNSSEPAAPKAPTKASLRAKEKAALKRIADNAILFDDVIRVLKPGDKVVGSFRGELVGGVVNQVSLQYSMFGRYWSVGLEVISASERGVVESHLYWTAVREWDGTKSIQSMEVRPMTDEVMTFLTKRGEIFRHATRKTACHMNYASEFMVPSWWDWTPFNGHGRVMIDGSGCSIMEPRVIQTAFSNLRSMDDDYSTEEKIPGDNLPDEKLFMAWPMLVAFSFRQKRWGVIKVEHLSDIEFDKTVFDKLVLDPERKDIIKSLVEHSGEAFADIVRGKSGGFIFLLHGAPGVGKTLTAEATAEVLERPLYVVSVGELGTSPEMLEEKLGKILEVADRWNAVLLLDESDVFLEQRTDHDLVRNAMVGIFLRLLEYFNGVMFLTTNRVKNFDKAFHSRISLAMNFPPIDTATRRQIWENLLNAANITNIDLDVVAALELNGRQIKNCIRLAQTMAIARNETVTTKKILGMTTFAEDFAKALTQGENYA